MSKFTLQGGAFALFGWLCLFSFGVQAQVQTYVAPAQVAPPSSVVVVHPQAPPAQVQVMAPVMPPPPVYVHTEVEPLGSVLRYSLQGFVAGALVGVSTGHLILHNDGGGEKWRGYLTATGIGAIAGAGTGLVLGFFDSAHDDRPARFVMRDALYGTLLGGVLGATIGGLVALNSHQGEDILLGTTIGTVSGFGLGVLVGVLEGQRKPKTRVQAGLASLRDVRGKQALGLQVSGRF